MSDRKLPQTMDRFRTNNAEYWETAKMIEAPNPPHMLGERLADVNLDKSTLRALSNIASHLCTSRLTDGFCRSERNPQCRCWIEANGILNAMDVCGVQPVWLYDKDEAKPAPVTSTQTPPSQQAKGETDNN